MVSFSCDVQPCDVKKVKRQRRLKGLFCVDAEASKQNFPISSNSLSCLRALSHQSFDFRERIQKVNSAKSSKN